MSTTTLQQLECDIQMSQTLQMLLPKCVSSATLASFMSLVQTLSEEFGPAAALEEVIQSLVGRHLQIQTQMRKTPTQEV